MGDLSEGLWMSLTYCIGRENETAVRIGIEKGARKEIA
jgi:hypothetical protein